MKRIIECVPNFSEGRNMKVIDAIASAIKQGGEETTCEMPGVKILNIDPGDATNRTVITFTGSPEAVLEGIFQGVKKAGELIDMRLHQGTHPRSGATDVLPLIPIEGISLEECAILARSLAERIYTELGIPCYCYEAAAIKPERKNLAVCRAGGYEALPEKISDPDRKPDYGPGYYSERAARSGATNVGARNFLIAVNFNLNTRSSDLANLIAYDVREKGHPKQAGNTSSTSMKLKGCKAIGWYIDEYGIAQVSMNITDIDSTPLHIAYKAVCEAAKGRGVEVTGTEIIGLVPKRVLTEAGEYFTSKKSEEISEDELIKTAVGSMRLDDLKPFNIRERVLEFLIGEDFHK